MKGDVDDIEKATRANDAFRHVIYTGAHLQLVLMTLQPGEEIGDRRTRRRSVPDRGRRGRR
jgi:hypothetical protein